MMFRSGGTPVWRRVPGFRSDVLWKQLVGLLGYGVIGTALIQGATMGRRELVVFAVLALAAIILAPLFSASRLDRTRDLALPQAVAAPRRVDVTVGPTQVHRSVTPVTNFCESCGAQRGPGAAFCAQCGDRFQSAEPIRGGIAAEQRGSFGPQVVLMYSAKSAGLAAVL